MLALLAVTKFPWGLKSELGKMTLLHFYLSMRVYQHEVIRRGDLDVSSERPEKRGIDLAIHGLVVERVIHYTTAAPDNIARGRSRRKRN